MRASLLGFFIAILSLSAVHAEPISYFQIDGVNYDASIPTPDERFGFGLGDRPVRHDQMVAYLRELAAISPRMSVETIGYTHETRPILTLVITSPENQARIEDIRAAHIARTERQGSSVDDADAPGVLWLNYGVHGAESSGMDAAVPTVYHLAAAQGAEIEDRLDDVVIVLTAIFNPDGHSRRVNHVYRYGADVPVTDPGHIQHNLWANARVNHYWFDLNRQWLPLTQPEPQAWIAQWHKWKPLLSVDYHEMGTNSTHYFHPGEPKRANPLMFDNARDLLGEVTDVHARSLDAEAALYYSEEGFDNFYIGKGCRGCVFTHLRNGVTDSLDPRFEDLDSSINHFHIINLN